MKRRNKQNGITLVALVITIIILLILAGISISALTNQGLFAKVQQAKQESENAQREENEILANYLEQMEAITGGEKTALENAETAKPSGARITVTDASKGIVMVDSKNNEWVWVEVPMSVTAGKTTDSEIETSLQTYAGDYRKGSSSQNYNWTDEWYDKCGTTYDGKNQYSQVKYITSSSYFTIAKEYYGTIYTDAGKTSAYSYTNGTAYYADITTKLMDKSGCGLTYSEYKTAKSKMLKSLQTNGGFWISRYEIGDSTATVNNTTRTSSSGITGVAVSKPNQIPYNFVALSQAQNLASGMSTDSNKTSSLLFGIQWDLTCKFLQEKGGLSVAQIKGGDGIGSIKWGNYNNSSLTLNRGKYLVNNTWTSFDVNTTNYVTNKQTSSNTSYYQLLTTGASEQTNKMNIYDFAGNAYEKTLEHCTSVTFDPCALRGGYFDNDGMSSPASVRSMRRYDGRPLSCRISFRTLLVAMNTGIVL